MAGDLLPEMKLAGIDIGTNTMLLLVARMTPDGVPVPLAEDQRTPRIGKNVDRDGRIRTEIFGTISSILRDYRSAAESHGVGSITCCATSAVRDASNRAEFLEYLGEHTGLTVEVIDGLTEARLTYRGVTIPPPPGNVPPVVLDIGGGSTEISYLTPGGGDGPPVLTCRSLATGSVRLTERYFESVPATPDQVARARASLLDQLGSQDPSGVSDPDLSGRPLIAVAGTATSLACIDLGLRRFDRTAVDGHVMSGPTVAAIAEMLLRMTPAQVRSLSEVTEGREDVLGAGALILSTMIDHLGFGGVTVSTRGLRHGIVIREWERTGGRGTTGSGA